LVNDSQYVVDLFISPDKKDGIIYNYS